MVGALVALAGGGGLWAYLGKRGSTKADLITIAQDAAARVIKGLTDEIERQDRFIMRQDARLAALELQDETCQRELAELKRRIL